MTQSEDNKFLSLTIQAQEAFAELNAYMTEVLCPALQKSPLQGNIDHVQWFLIGLNPARPTDVRNIEQAEHRMGARLDDLSYSLEYNSRKKAVSYLTQRLEGMHKLFAEQGDFKGSGANVFNWVASTYLMTSFDRPEDHTIARIPEEEQRKKWKAKDFFQDTIEILTEHFSPAADRIRQEMAAYADADIEGQDIRYLTLPDFSELPDAETSERLQRVEAVREENQKPPDDRIDSILSVYEDKVTACVKPLRALYDLAKENGLFSENRKYGRLR